jgi:hypothetical protein
MSRVTAKCARLRDLEERGGRRVDYEENSIEPCMQESTNVARETFHLQLAVEVM